MDQSQYLAMALQQMGAPPQPTAGQPGMSLAQMQKMAQDRQAWEAANPAQSYMGHGLAQMGANLLGAPGRAADALGSIPGQAMSGLQALAARFGGGQTAPY